MQCYQVVWWKQYACFKWRK